MSSLVNIRNYIIAGKKARTIKLKIKEYITLQKIVKISLLYDYIITLIKLENCRPKFPPNINGPRVVAHDTVYTRDKRVIKIGVIKIDLGIVYKECIVDTAFSISFNTHAYQKYHEINELFFNTYVPTILKPGLKIKQLSAFIETYYKTNGMYVIPNLVGHTIKPPVLHTTPYIPAVTMPYEQQRVLEPGQIFTIEPHTAMYASNIVEGSIRIYQCKNEFYSVKDKKLGFNNSRSKGSIICHKVLKLEESPVSNESFLYEHTYYTAEDKVIQIS